MKQIKEVFDRYTEKFISRKFLAWIVSCYMCYKGVLTSEDWVAVTLGYMGIQGAVDMATQWKRGLSSPTKD